jgi:uncharacterized protein YndB with AHSA1/START domain
VTEESDHVVRIERTFAASAEDVFDAWTSPEVMRRWFHCAPDWETPEAEVDLRLGGKVRVVMRMPDGSEVEAQGVYTLIDRPHRLLMTWTFDDHPSNEQLIELSFSESGGSTTVLMVNSGISTDDRRDAQDWGWRGCLDELERVLAGRFDERGGCSQPPGPRRAALTAADRSGPASSRSFRRGAGFPAAWSRLAATGRRGRPDCEAGRQPSAGCAAGRRG